MDKQQSRAHDVNANSELQDGVGSVFCRRRSGGELWPLASGRAWASRGGCHDRRTLSGAGRLCAASTPRAANLAGLTDTPRTYNEQLTALPSAACDEHAGTVRGDMQI